MNLLHRSRQQQRTLFSTLLSLVLLGCLVLSCLQLPQIISAVAQTEQGTMAMADMPVMDHACCEPASSNCPLEIPLSPLFTSLDSPQFFPLLWIVPLAASLLAIFQLQQRLYQRSPPSAWRSYLPSYPRLHVQQAVFLN